MRGRSGISIIAFGVGVVIFGAFWMAWKPIMDALNDIIPGMPDVTAFESSWFEMLPFMVMGVILVSLVIAATKRGGGGSDG